MKVNRILAGIDLGEDTEKVLAYASFFTSRMSASLHTLYVIDYLVTPPSYLAPYIEEEKKIAEEKFTPWKKRLENGGVTTDMETMIGRLFESFDSAVKNINADMVVLGFRSHVLRRSSSERLIKGLQMPMLVVRGEKADSAKIGSVGIRKILCPVDFSETSMNALKSAKELKDIFSAEFEVMHVVPTHFIKERAAVGKDTDRITEELFNEARNELQRFLSDAGIEKSGIVEEGEPFKKIASFSAENNIELIVIGARGLSFIKEMLIGSVTDAVLKSSPCPVLLIH